MACAIVLTRRRQSALDAYLIAPTNCQRLKRPGCALAMPAGRPASQPDEQPAKLAGAEASCLSRKKLARESSLIAVLCASNRIILYDNFSAFQRGRSHLPGGRAGRPAGAARRSLRARNLIEHEGPNRRAGRFMSGSEAAWRVEIDSQAHFCAAGRAVHQAEASGRLPVVSCELPAASCKLQVASKSQDARPPGQHVAPDARRRRTRLALARIELDWPPSPLAHSPGRNDGLAGNN